MGFCSFPLFYLFITKIKMVSASLASIRERALLTAERKDE